MPYAAKKECAHPRCPDVVPSGQRHCTKHKRAEVKQYERGRGSSSERGYDRKWQKIRAVIIARDPVCKACNRKPTTDVDHITPRRRGGTDAESNLQGLCHTCHSSKTATEDGRWG